ncbi:MAG TPA: glycosyltransferase [Leeuwenhoekiella sp.]|nr:glycosyltransferase [Leeuwenhoekiella sp.]
MRVLQLIDSLQAGGAERMAVNYANALVSHVEKSFLCATREEGPLLDVVDKQVDYLFLNRLKTLDVKALNTMRAFVKDHKINIIHAHGTSFFIASLLKIFKGSIVIIWHNHSFYTTSLPFTERIGLRLCSHFFDVILCVNEPLQKWSRQILGHKKAYYIKNFVVSNDHCLCPKTFKGVAGKRIVCVANFRPVKNHGLLLDAFAQVVKKDPEATLHLFGSHFNDIYAQSILEIVKFNVPSVYYHGMHPALSSVLPLFDVGVLSSDSEGLPLALLEYGQAGLPVVVTDVGQCREVLGGYGSCVEVGNAKSLAKEMYHYLKNPKEGKKIGRAFQREILDFYGRDTILPQVMKIYEEALKEI